MSTLQNITTSQVERLRQLWTDLYSAYADGGFSRRFVAVEAITAATRARLRRLASKGAVRR
jgi:hypothetical protein